MPKTSSLNVTFKSIVSPIIFIPSEAIEFDNISGATVSLINNVVDEGA